MRTDFLDMNFRRSSFSLWSVIPAVVSLLAAAMIGLPGAARAQSLSLDTTFQAPLFTLGVQPDRVLVLANGQFLVFSGFDDPFVGFDRYNNAKTGNLLRFNADGSLDTTFALDPALYAKSVSAVAAMANGQYVITTNFVSNSGTTSQIYRLNTDGSLDNSLIPGAGTGSNGLFRCIAVQSDGRIIAGGTGTTQYNGTAITDIVRLNTDGSIDTTFNVVLGTGASGPLGQLIGLDGINTSTGIQIQSDDKIILAGGFTTVNGVTRADVARLNADGSLDTTFVPSGYGIASDQANDFSEPARTAAIQSDGKIVVGGEFNATSNPSTDQPLVRLDTDGSLDRTFNAATLPQRVLTYFVRVTPGGALIFGTDGAATYEYNSDGSANTTFQNNFPFGYLPDLGVLPNGQLLAVGDYDPTNATVASGITRLNADGTVDTSVRFATPQADSPPYHVAALPNGTILAAGEFDAVAGQPRAGLAILNANGSLNAATLPSSLLAGNYYFEGAYEGTFGPDFILQSDDDKILLFGSTPPPDEDSGPGFTYLRLNADLSVDTTLTADPSVTAFGTVLYQPGNGYLLSAGYPSASLVINTTDALDPANLLRRLSLQGALDSDFVPAIDVTTIFDNFSPGNLANATLYAGDDTALAVQPDGKILYQYYDKTEAYRLVRFNADGSMDSSFQIGSAPPTSPPDTGFTDPIDAGDGDEQAFEVSAASIGIGGAFVQSDGRILIYGDFATYNGQTAKAVARLNANGTVDTTFSTGTGPQGPGGVVGSAYAVTTAQQLSNGQLLLVGGFTTFNGVARPGLVRLNTDGSVDTAFTAAGVVSQQVSIGPAGFGSGNSSLAPVGNGTYFLTGNYTNTDGEGAGTFFRLFGGVSTTPTPVSPVVPSSLPSFFNGAVPLSGGFYYLAFANGNLFGYYNLDFYPYLYHSDLGFEYVIDANDGKSGVYLYDFASKTFFYTSPSYPFPYLYDFTLKTVLYYFPDTGRPGHYTSNPRYFYNFATQEVITK